VQRKWVFVESRWWSSLAHPVSGCPLGACLLRSIARTVCPSAPKGALSEPRPDTPPSSLSDLGMRLANIFPRVSLPRLLVSIGYFSRSPLLAIRYCLPATIMVYPSAAGCSTSLAIVIRYGVDVSSTFTMCLTRPMDLAFSKAKVASRQPLRGL